MNKLKFLNADTPEQAELNQLLFDHLQPITPDTAQCDALHANLMQRITHSLAHETGLLTVRMRDGVWENLMRGICFKRLWQGFEGNAVLIEFAPGASLSAHRHQWIEEGMVLRGGLQMGDLDLGPLDYHLSSIGSRHAKIHSRQGALAYLRGTSLGDKSSVVKEYLGGLLPAQGPPSLTVYASDTRDWQPITKGVYKKHLNAQGDRISYFLRLEIDAELQDRVAIQDEECMVLQGEVFFGDRLLQAWDYQVTFKGASHGKLYTDVGVLLFIRCTQE